jgi:hypothetical protein
LSLTAVMVSRLSPWSACELDLVQVTPASGVPPVRGVAR